MTQANLQVLDGGLALQALSAQPDVDGSFRVVRTNEHRNPTFRYAGTSAMIIAGGGASDIIVIGGSATRTLRIKRIALGGIATAAAMASIQLTRRSAANSGGTKTTVTPGSHESTDGSATGSVAFYTGTTAPTPGASAGILGQGRLGLAVSSATVPVPYLVWEFGTRGDKPIILRGASDFLVINALAALPAGNNIDFEIEIEEDQS